MLPFTIISEITNREVIASGRGIRDLDRPTAEYGEGNWRKCKGRTKVEFADGTSDEGYLYPAQYFEPIEVSPQAEEVLQTVWERTIRELAPEGEASEDQ